MAKYTKENIRAIAQTMNHAKGQGRPFALLTGAGCSVSANIPTAPQLLDEINSSGLGENIRQKLGTDSLRKRRYGEVMAFLNPEERKEIIGPFLKDAKVNWGNLALAGLMKEEYIGRVLTFNFDPVHAKACGIIGHYPAIYDFSQVPDAKGDFSYIAPSAILHLHGQGTSLTMMNSEAQTKEHAEKLQPLFQDTLHRFDVIVIGYSGDADEAFDTLKSARSDRRTTWCSFENTAAPHVKSLIDECGNMGQHFEEVDFDEFMIDLATELKCFPPLLFTGTAAHLKLEMAHIVKPPASLKSAQGHLAAMEEKLKIWHQSENTIEVKLRNALLRNDWDEAIALENDVKSAEEKELLSWAFIEKGNAFAYQAETGKDEDVFRKSFLNFDKATKINIGDAEAYYNWGRAIYKLAVWKNDIELFDQAAQKFEIALKSKPYLYFALNNWGQSLSASAKIVGDRDRYREAFTKFAAALKLKPNFDSAYYNWGVALSELAELSKEEELYFEAIEKYEKAIRLNPGRHDALYNWGVILIDLAEAKNDDEILLREAISKFKAALAIKSDKHEALYNWGVALTILANAKNNDETLLREAISKFERVLFLIPEDYEALGNLCNALVRFYRINRDPLVLQEAEAKGLKAEELSGKANFDLACVYALQHREEDCQQQLLRCKADGTLPSATHLQTDSDLEAYRAKDWFKELTVE